MNFNFYLGIGGIGDYLLFLSTFYHKIQKEDKIIFFANSKEIGEAIHELKFVENQHLIFSSFSQDTWFRLSQSDKCLGTGITPRHLDFKEWYKVNPFEKYGVNQNPEFINKINEVEGNYVTIQLTGGSSKEESLGKIKRISKDNIDRLKEELKNEKVYIIGTRDEQKIPDEWFDYSHKNILFQAGLIKSSKKFIGVDSWCKTWACMCKVPTEVYSTLYVNNYLDVFEDNKDYGDYVFLEGWNLTQIKQK